MGQDMNAVFMEKWLESSALLVFEVACISAYMGACIDDVKDVGTKPEQVSVAVGAFTIMLAWSCQVDDEPHVVYAHDASIVHYWQYYRVNMYAWMEMGLVRWDDQCHCVRFQGEEYGTMVQI